MLLGGRLALIHHLGTSLPYRDQWQCTADDLLGPWVDGRLHAGNFLAPFNDHWPVLTRLLSFGLVWLNGQWNNLLETSVNALLYAAAAWLFLATITPALGRKAGPLFALLTAIVLGLPVTWENTLWGIQSLVFFQILLSLVYLRAVAAEKSFSAGWWLGQLAGLLVLFTQQSGVLAYVAAGLLLAWRWVRRDGDRRLALAGLFFAVVGIAGYFAAAPAFSVTAALRADSWRIALDVFLRQLGWPRPHPAWAFLFWLPWLWFAADRLVRPQITATDAFIMVVGLWVGAQAAAIGYGRGGETTGFVSRYCDFLAWGFLTNAACLGRLWHSSVGRRVHGSLAMLGVAWLGFSTPGLWHETFHGHAGYTFIYRAGINAQNLGLVRSFLASGDPATLAPERGSDSLFPNPQTVAGLLRDPRFRALLPPETGATEARADYGRLGVIARVLPPAGPYLVPAGLVLLLFGATRIGRGPADVVPPSERSAWSLRRVWLSWAAVTGGFCGLWAWWPQPMSFEATERWTKAYAPEREGIEFIEPVFRQIASGPRIRPEQARGAVDIEPAEIRPSWYGTKIGGYDFTGILRSDPIGVHHRYLFTPYTGWPSWPGNGLRWRLENPQTKEEIWLPLIAPNPEGSVAIWTTDVARYQGWQASLHLFDGNTDAAHGWLGIARPATGDDPDFGRWWLAQIRGERAEPTHRTLAAAALLALTLWAVLTVRLYHRHQSLRGRAQAGSSKPTTSPTSSFGRLDT